ncbi:MAG: DUF2807 domain-containing protein [Defluviitaleaceae bacterium]|nr:DUF2807 domain-containing protein [Defluviitaleaceae bacterium]
MYKKFIIIVLLISLVLLLTGCIIGNRNTTINMVNGITGTGPMVTQDIEVANFNTLEISGNFRVIFIQSPEPSLTVIMQENLFEYFAPTVQGSNLQITPHRGFNTTSANRPRLYVSAPYLTAVDFSGAVSADGWDTIQGQRFTIEASGAVSLDLDIEVNNLSIEASGAVSLDLDLNVERLDLEISGAANADLYGVANVINIYGFGAINLRAGNLQVESGSVELSGASNASLSTLENINVTTSGLARVREAS